jgi:bacterioferritin
MRPLRTDHPPDHGRSGQDLPGRQRLQPPLADPPRRHVALSPRQTSDLLHKGAFQGHAHSPPADFTGGQFRIIIRNFAWGLAKASGIRNLEMRGDATVVEYLNKALRHELTAVNQYWLHYRLLENWGYNTLAKIWRKESIEEMEHADKLVHRIIFLDGFPNMQVLDPLHIGQTVKEVLDCDLAAEMSARALYEEAATHCHAVKDYVTRDLFERLMKDEEEHIDFLETQLELVKRLGLELYAQYHIGEAKEHS